MKDKATEQIGIRVTKDLKEKLQDRADFEGRSLANLVIRACEEYLTKIDEAKRLLNKKD